MHSLTQKIQRAYLDKLSREAFYFAAVLALGLLIYFLTHRREHPDLLMSLVAIIFIGAGGILLLASFWNLSRRSDHPIIEVLHERPDDLVWIYPYILIHNPFGVRFSRNCHLYFWDVKGNQIMLRVSEKKAEEIKKELKPLLSKCTFGHSVEREQLYRVDPLLLRPNSL